MTARSITLGTGVGGGIVAHNRVFDGWNGGGTEAGHIPLILGGEPCGCGRRRCFEAQASATALIRQTRWAMEAHPESALWQICPDAAQVNAKTPFDAALLGDQTARTVLDTYEEYLAAGIGGIVNLLRPQAVILGGGVSNQGRHCLPPCEKNSENTVTLRSLLPRLCWCALHWATRRASSAPPCWDWATHKRA